MNWTIIPGFGVAGNFTGHLEQAGESPDFVTVSTKDANAPKGIFPFYIPNLNHPYLANNPYSNDTIQLFNHTENHQIEPEVSILFEVTYQDSQIVCLQPIQAFAHNDCSIRRPGAKKISEKKNWGADSKGIAQTGIALDNLEANGTLDRFKLGCYLLRDGVLQKYGETSWVKDYSYFHHTLLDWLVEKLNHQQDHGPLENVHQYLQAVDFPNQICISIGATRYTELGETTFLQTGDTSCVVLYDAHQYTESDIEQHLLDGRTSLPNASVLRQQVIGPTA